MHRPNGSCYKCQMHEETPHQMPRLMPPKPSRTPARRSNAPRCFCGRRYRLGSRMGISSLRLGTGTDPQPSHTSIGLLTKRLCRPPAGGSSRRCLKSWTYIHNETVNIFSHLIGSLLFFILPVGVYKELAPRYATADRADVFVFATFFSGVRDLLLLCAFDNVG